MTDTSDLLVRLLVGSMLISVASGLLVLRARPPHQIRAFWLDSGGPVRALLYVLLLFACWLPSFSLVALLLVGVPFIAEPLGSASPEIRIAMLLSLSASLCLAFYWYMLRQVPR